MNPDSLNRPGLKMPKNDKRKRIIIVIVCGLFIICCIAAGLIIGALTKNNNVPADDQPTESILETADEPESTEAEEQEQEEDSVPIIETAPAETIEEVPEPVSDAGYYIAVNREQNVVIVYTINSNGETTGIAKVFVASTGAPDSETPLGTFSISDRFEALYLVGDVWGHYATRINGRIYFHSVPYFSKGAPWDNLEYIEYNKLGTGASAGCVRLAVADAKWIYDNVAYGTTVEIYDSDTLPSGVTKPSAIKIDENSPNRGWDPTDPDPDNPWH